MVLATIVALFHAFFCMSLAAGEDPPICPDETTVTPSQHSTTRKEVSLEFINDAGIDLSVFWVNFDGDEIPVCTSANCYLTRTMISVLLRECVYIYTI